MMSAVIGQDLGVRYELYNLGIGRCGIGWLSRLHRMSDRI